MGKGKNIKRKGKEGRGKEEKKWEKVNKYGKERENKGQEEKEGA